jgi:Ca2+-binding RTX toxin-like protein
VEEIEMNRKIASAIAGLGLVLLALAPAAAQADVVSVSMSGPQSQYVQANGDDSANTIHLAQVTDPQCPGGAPCVEIDAGTGVIAASAPCVVAPAGGHRALCPITTSPGVSADGRGGNDSVVAAFTPGIEPPPLGLHGGPGNDAVQGSDGLAGDLITGDEGNDTVHAGQGTDVVLGNAGRDRIYGEGGGDLIKGGSGFDNLIGGLARDHLFGEAGNDGMDGGQGHDVCTGGGGHDAARHCESVRSIP